MECVVDTTISADGRDPSGNVWWRFEHSLEYREVTLMFLEAVLSMDPNSLIAIVQTVSPFHSNTLLQLSDVWSQQGDHGLANSFNLRTIYSFSKALTPSFQSSIQNNGNSRLSFRYIENRLFFLAISKNLLSLIKRGCFRTAFEWARILFSLNPYEDPHGALGWLEFLSGKCGIGEWRWWEGVCGVLEERGRRGEDGEGGGDVRWGLEAGGWFARALGKWKIEDEERRASDIPISSSLLSLSVTNADD